MLYCVILTKHNLQLPMLGRQHYFIQFVTGRKQFTYKSILNSFCTEPIQHIHIIVYFKACIPKLSTKITCNYLSQSTCN